MADPSTVASRATGPPTAEATYARLAALRAITPVTEVEPGVFFVASRAGATQVLADAARFSGRHGDRVPGTRVTLFEEDAGAHASRRRILARALSGTRRRHLASTTRRIAQQRLRPGLERGDVDAVRELAEPVTRQAMGHLLGIATEDQAWVYGLVSTIRRERLAQRTPSRSDAADAFRAWVLAEAHQRRAPSGAEPEGLAALRLPDRLTGYVLTEDELVLDVQQLCQSAMGATRLLIANVLLRLASDPALFALVQAQRKLVAPLVEESLRFDAPVRLAKRTCTAPVAIDGTQVAPGDELLLSLTSANRDEHTIDHPDRFDVMRERHPHVAFGWGPHRCPGAAIARTIATSTTRVVLDEAPALHLPADFAYEPQPFLDGLRFHGPSTLPLRFAPPV